MAFQKGNQLRKGLVPWNKGKRCNYLLGNQHAEGNIPWNKGLKGRQPWHNTSGLKPVKKGNQLTKGNPPNRTSFKKGQNKGKDNINWKGGEKLSKGCVYSLRPNHPFATKSGYVRRSRLIMEEKIHRYLNPKEVVHHINEDILDDHSENLMLFSSQSEHLKYHQTYRLSKRTRQ